MEIFSLFSLYIMSNCGSLHPLPSGVGESPPEDNCTGHTKYLGHPISGSRQYMIWALSHGFCLIINHLLVTPKGLERRGEGSMQAAAPPPYIQ